ncbi:MAG: peroxiredoxin [Crocinitomicaceae bacterium]|nr:peroxiredoxin [Crocinitomicaceae bacterium]
MPIKTGDNCPTFELNDQEGRLRASKEFFNKKALVLYFYPKDDSPGCTAQACSFRDAYEDLLELGAEVVGVSGDSLEQHKKFAKKHNLPFTLLADINNKLRKRFGVPTNLFGLIPGRVTYVIDSEGTVRGVFNSQIDVKRHVKKALEIIEKL